MLDRRSALQAFITSSFSLLTAQALGAPSRKVLKVAGIGTQYFKNSHCDVILTKIMEGWDHLGFEGPKLQLTSMYIEQQTDNDLSKAKSKANGVPLYSSIEQALTLGTEELRCDAVLSIAEHGDYEVDPVAHQRKYPRRRFFDAIADVFQKTGRVVPVFNDKHLSWNWKDAKAMYDRARAMKIPMQSGSSLPFSWRYPNATIPVGSKIKTITGVAYGGLESYGFHALETIQCLMERRKGGETGVKSIQAYPYEQMWNAEKAGRWNRESVAIALRAAGKSADNLEGRLHQKDSSIYVIDYLDGTKAVCCMFNGITDEMSVAVEIEGTKKPLGQWFKLEMTYPYRHFEQLVRGIDRFFHTRKEHTPLERTLLTTGILARAISSHFAGGPKYATPELAIQYRPGTRHFANQFEENFPEPIQYE